MKTNFILFDNGTLPSYTTEGSAAMDVRAAILEPYKVYPGEKVAIPLGFGVDLQKTQVAGLLMPRSGLSRKHGIVLANTVGLMDMDYQGQYIAAITNVGDRPYEIQPQERIAQCMFLSPIIVEPVECDHFAEVTTRGDGGFGHSGKD